jgi:16S rRNA (uracil1498-N3)-methyltransferase
VRRFFINAEDIVETEAIIRGDLFHHLATVLRMRHGDHLILADGKGTDYMATIEAIDPDKITASIKVIASSSTKFLTISLLQALPKGDKIEVILQKCTELGATEFTPLVAERSIPKISSDKEVSRRDRWQKIVAEAARQCQRHDIPPVHPIVSFKEALTANGDLKLLLWEKEEVRTLREELECHEKPEKVAILIGPEGGLTDKEAQQAIAAGFVPVTLGARILRTETAGMAVIAVLQYVWGDFGS